MGWKGRGRAPSSEPSPASAPSVKTATDAATPAATGATSRDPAVATFSAWTSPRWRDGPPTGVNSSMGTR